MDFLNWEGIPLNFPLHNLCISQNQISQTCQYYRIESGLFHSHLLRSHLCFTQMNLPGKTKRRRPIDKRPSPCQGNPTLDKN